MLNALKKLFGIRSQEKTQEVPYKVEAPKVDQFPFPAKTEKKTADKKPAVKAKTARKPRTPKAPKA